MVVGVFPLFPRRVFLGSARRAGPARQRKHPTSHARPRLSHSPPQITPQKNIRNRRHPSFPQLKAKRGMKMRGGGEEGYLISRGPGKEEGKKKEDPGPNRIRGLFLPRPPPPGLRAVHHSPILGSMDRKKSRERLQQLPSSINRPLQLSSFHSSPPSAPRRTTR